MCVCVMCSSGIGEIGDRNNYLYIFVQMMIYISSPVQFSDSNGRK